MTDVPVELAVTVAALESIVHRYARGNEMPADLAQVQLMSEQIFCIDGAWQTGALRELSATCLAGCRALAAASSPTGDETMISRLSQNLAALRLSLVQQEMKVQSRTSSEKHQTKRVASTSCSNPTSASDGAVAAQDDTIMDEPDMELLGVFLEEGRDLLPQVGEILHQLQYAPDNPELFRHLLRPLHTMKGSARMAGAMRLGKHIHDLESRIGDILQESEPTAEAVADLLARYDTSLQLFEALHCAVVPTEASETFVASACDEALQPSEDQPVQASYATPLVRVRAGVLDRLLNQVGEMSISRYDLNTQVGLLHEYLDALGGNVARLNTLLRTAKTYAEMQTTAPDERQSQDWSADPLQSDRLIQLRELTHILTESVDDVGSLQKNLLATLVRAQNSLIQQERLNREIKRELMQVRMVQFRTLEERLHRLVRQLAKETGKQLQLHVVGGAVKLDRSILEKMVGPLEHLLRNAVVHGIEPATQRLAAGKKPAGQLLLEIRQEGNEAMIRLSDDGKGLDLSRIKEKMIEEGMTWEGEDVTDKELMGVIFHPGFTTYSDITAIAGRGIGLDVVRSEVMSSGGRVGVDTTVGRGVQFTIHLPLSLAVAQVLLFDVGEQTYAIPSLLMAQILLIKRAEQEQMFCSGTLDWKNRKLPVHYLSALLGTERDVPQRETLPVLLVKNDHDVLAILVDHVIGNREIITKRMGPQLAHMIGVVGATVLGSGSIVLILNPIQLVQHHVRQKRLRHASSHLTDTGLDKKTVLVVDDSLTVRRVMQRLLSREGYHVVLATDGVDALHQLQRRKPDMVLLDIEMPRMDGFDLVRNIRNRYDATMLPIVVITSRTSAGHRKRAMDLGASDYLGKPYQADVLLRTIRELLRPGFLAGHDCIPAEHHSADDLSRKTGDQHG